MTLFGAHVVSEVSDLLNVWDARILQLQDQANAYYDTWEKKDAAGHADWMKDWDALVARWAPAKDHAKTIILATPHMQDYTPAENVWQELLNALAPGQTGHINKGDFDDLSARMTAAGKPAVYTGAANAQPTAVDADLGAYKAADTAVKGIDAAGKSVSLGWSQAKPYVIGGGVLVGLIAAVKLLK